VSVLQNKYPVTVVSAYWAVKSKHLVSSYGDWFQNTLRVQCPYVFFHDSDKIIKMVSGIRQPSAMYPTHFIRRNLTDAALKFNYRAEWTHQKHVRSSDLAVVWLDKVYMMSDVADMNPYHSEWFAWIDAGVAMYREQKMPSTVWPNPAILPHLPKHRIIYSDSGAHPAHSFAGTAFMYHGDIVTTVRDKFMQVYETCVNKYSTEQPRKLWVCGIDQGHFTEMKKAEPDLFVNTGVGYGAMVQELFKPNLDANIPALIIQSPSKAQRPRGKTSLVGDGHRPAFGQRQPQRLHQSSRLPGRSAGL